jgi:tetratricopeptide (TPR) repeat protein
MSASSKSKPNRDKVELNLLHADECCVCGLATENVVTCHGCHQRDYCSRACQKTDWKLHRHGCLRKKDACEKCGKKEGLNSCAGCFQRLYCSPECQKDAWPEHKAICKAYKYVGRDVTDPEQVAIKLSEYAARLGASNLRESELRVAIEFLELCKASKLPSDFTLTAMYNLSGTLTMMSRYPEAEIFAREMVAESEKLKPICDHHVFASHSLTEVLCCQERYEEALSVAHDAVERFRTIVPEGEAMVRLMEAKSVALCRLQRPEEALALQQRCMKTRLDHPERFNGGGKVPSACFYDLTQSLIGVGRLGEAEAMLKKTLAMVKSDGIEFHPDVVATMCRLVEVYRLQSRKKEAAAMMTAVKKLVPNVFPKDHPAYKTYMETQ